MDIRKYIGSLLTTHGSKIEEWLLAQQRQSIPFFYTSVDIRHAGFKIAPVDTNLFPAGFNILSLEARKIAVEQAKQYVQTYYPNAKTILIIGENHTRNRYYLENLFVLSGLLQQAGYRVQLTAPGINEEMPLETAEGSTILFSPLSRQDDQLVVNGLVADLILLNNDMTGGTPEIVSGIRQPILPDPSLGWYKRRKTTHFDAYNDVVRLFGAEFGIDHWLLSTYTHKCGKINFRERNGLECVAMGVERTIARIARKYEEYGVKETPYVFIKSNYGTYGMGIMTARNAEDVLSINKKARHSMDVIKQGVSNAEVIIQEGVPTADRINGQVAESLIYMVGGAPVGCNYRLNEHRDAYSNLNSPGMTFGHACEGDKEAPDALHGGCPVLGLIAKLAHLAAVRECYDYAYAI